MLTAVIFFLSLAMMMGLIIYDEKFISMNMADINEKDVDFFYVFSQNVILISKIYLLGLLTFNMFSIFTWLQNIVSVGLIGNSLVHNDNGMLAAKMIPHGVFEFLGIALAVSTVMWMWAKIIKNVPKVAKREKDVIELGKEVLTVGTFTYVLNIVIFLGAGVIEMFVSLYKVTG